ncbi:MAG TPA: hypothetical protein VJ692_09825 [Nitrospiraceae bacterium]|nr:hypothetical protein [Nitrospiraceae bacterium]
MKEKLSVMTVCVLGIAIGLMSFRPTIAHAVAEPQEGAWTYGASTGFLGNTPSQTAWAFNAHADRFFSRVFSVGPLAQVALTGPLSQIGLSAQARYWLELPNNTRTRIVFQAGFGFIHTDRLNSDNSWLLPIGIGVDHLVSRKVALTADFLINFTDIDPGNGRDRNVMPGFTVGVRF